MRLRRSALASVFGLASVITLAATFSGHLDRPVQPSDVSSAVSFAKASPTPTIDAYAHNVYAMGAAASGVTVQDTPVPPTPVPTPTPTAIPTPVRPSCVFTAPPWFDTWPDHLVCEAIGVALCESTFNPAAINGKYHGLFQMQRSWFDDYGVDWELRYDPYVNSALAARIVQVEGWWPWSCRPRG